MSSLVYVIPTKGVDIKQMVEAFAGSQGWTSSHELGAIEFSRLVLNHFVQNAVESYQANQAAEVVRQNTRLEVNSVLSNVTTTLQIIQEQN